MLFFGWIYYIIDICFLLMAEDLNTILLQVWPVWPLTGKEGAHCRVHSNDILSRKPGAGRGRAHAKEGPWTWPDLWVAAEVLLCFFYHLFNCSLSQHSNPSLWKSPIICPVAKKSYPTCDNDYGPAAPTSLVMKGFGKLILSQQREVSMHTAKTMKWLSTFTITPSSSPLCHSLTSW